MITKRHTCGKIIEHEETTNAVNSEARDYYMADGEIVTYCPECEETLTGISLEAVDAVEMLRDGETVDLLTAKSIRRDYVCSRCWGQLNVFQNGQDYVVGCVDGCGGGFVRRSWAERRRAENVADYLDALHNLGGILGIERKPQSEKQLISELGF